MMRIWTGEVTFDYWVWVWFERDSESVTNLRTWLVRTAIIVIGRGACWCIVDLDYNGKI